jgi:dihydrofolate synthase/folylpolyglutamate synthase
MMELKTFTDIEAALAAYIPAVKELSGRAVNLDRMFPLMVAVGNPEKKLKIVHIAGTSGKTSTAYYIASLLVQAGKKVGLTISPHIDSVAERVQINLKPISENDFAKSLSDFINLVEVANIQPTYFEILIAFVYWYFAKSEVDYAVIETGLGGLLDGTNVAQRADKLCVITDIGFDHMQVLGSTLPEIAAQKAGIIHEANQALMFEQPDEVVNVFKNWCANIGGSLEVLEQTSLEIPGFAALPQYQQRNWLLAYEAYKFLQKRDELETLNNEQLMQTMLGQVPGRMDEVTVGSKKIIMDGAHNSQKMQAFVDSLKKKYPGQKVSVLLGLKQDKQFREVLPLLLAVTNKLIVTTFTSGQDLPSVGINPTDLAAEAKNVGFEDIVVELDCNNAYDALLDSADSTLIITGSFYLIGELRHTHKELQGA